MIRLRPFFALVLVLLPTAALPAQDKLAAPDKPQPPSPWVVDRALNVAPQVAPLPAMKYRLLPLSWELKEGNAVPIYLRLTHEQSDASRKYWMETPKPWNKLPISEIPLADARKFIEHQRYPLRQLEIGARRRTAEWNYTVEEPNPIGLLLPDVQWMRNYAPMLILQARVALAEGDFTAAARHLETAFGFCRHVAEGPTLIHSLVAIAIATECASAVADFVERPDAPNLYWALTILPHPLIDLREGLGFEYQTVDKQFPELVDLERERTAEQWDAALRRVRTELHGLARGSREVDRFPKDCAPGDPAAKSPDLPEARKFVARTKGLSAEKVEAMPPAHVLLLYIAGTYHEDRDDWHKISYLPYPQARPLFDASMKRLRAAPTTEGHVPARLLLSALNRVMSRQNLLDRNLAALQVIEALRLHAAAHDGKLPDKLSDVTEVPVPNNPGTGKPFEYRREGDTGTITSQIPDDPIPNNGVRYRVTIRKK